MMEEDTDKPGSENGGPEDAEERTAEQDAEALDETEFSEVELEFMKRGEGEAERIRRELQKEPSDFSDLEWEEGIKGWKIRQIILWVMGALTFAGIGATGGILIDRTFVRSRAVSSNIGSNPDKESNEKKLSDLSRDMENIRRKLMTALETKEKAEKKLKRVEEELKYRQKIEIKIDDVPIRPAKSGRNCAISAVSLQKLMKEKGWRLVQQTPAPDPTYLFIKRIGDITSYIRVFAWDMKPVVRWDRYKKGTTVSVRALEWHEARGEK